MELEYILNSSALYGIPIWAFAILIVWSLIWKGIALWKSAGRKEIIWFIIFLVINTVGILEILYLFIFSKIGTFKGGKKKIKRKR